MADYTSICRVNDGLLLVASYQQDKRLEPYRRQEKGIIKKISAGSPSRMSIESGDYVYNYILEDGIWYMALCKREYPRRRIFQYLVEIREEFIREAMKMHGDRWKSAIDVLDRPYAFIKFDHYIQLKRREYANPEKPGIASKLGSELVDIHHIMCKNITEVLDKEKHLDRASTISRDLVRDSHHLKRRAKHLNDLEFLKKFAPAAAFIVVILFVIWWKLF